MEEGYNQVTSRPCGRKALHAEISCLERTVKEVGGAVKLFMERSVDNRDRTGILPSWKYPHMSMNHIEVDMILAKLQGMNMKDEELYTHLAELLVDRLYYTLLISVNHLKFYCDNLYGNEEEDRTLKPSQAVHNIREKHGDTCEIMSFQIPIRMSQLIQQLTANFLLLEGSILIFGTEGKFLSSADRLKPNSNVISNCDPVEDPTVENVPICKSCLDIGYIVKSVEQTLNKCIKAISRDCAKPGINKLIVEREPIPWETLIITCDNIQQHCKSIVESVKGKLEKRVSLEVNSEELQTHIYTQNTEHELRVTQIGRKVQELTKELEGVRKSKARFQEDVASSELKIARLKEIINGEREEIRNQEDLIIALKHEKEELNKKYEKLVQSVETAKLRLDTRQKENEDILAAIKTVKEASRSEKELMTLKSKPMADELNQTKISNLRLRKDIAILTKQIQGMKNSQKQEKTLRAKTMEKLKSLQEQVTRNTSDIKLQLMYPDLNGPVNPPVMDDEDCVATLEQQIIANEQREQLLLKENAGLSTTISMMRTNSAMVLD